MANSSKPKRPYHSTRRQAQARQTRQQITEAARNLFTRSGYAGATIEAIAREADVSPETVYAVFGSKRKILEHLLNVSVGGDDAPIPILERPGPQAIFQESDQRKQFRGMARDMAVIMARSAPIFEVMRMAAKTEPDIADLLQHRLKGRRENMGIVIERFAANGDLREGLSQAEATDILWALTSPELFLLLTVDRGWSSEQYSEWLGETLIRLLLP